MNGYPVSGKIFSPNLTNDILQPIGQKLKPDQVYITKSDDTQSRTQAAPLTKHYGRKKEKDQSGTSWFENRK